MSEMPYQNNSRDKCPHCRTMVRFDNARHPDEYSASMKVEGYRDSVYVGSSECPVCEEPIVVAHILRNGKEQFRMVHPRVRRERKFGTYWIPGLIIVLISLFMNYLLRGYVDYVIHSPHHYLFSLLLPIWFVITIVGGAVFLILLPWMFGHLIEIFQYEFMSEK